MRGGHRGVYRRPETDVLVDITRYSSETDSIRRATPYVVEYDPTEVNNGITNPIENHKGLFSPGSV